MIPFVFRMPERGLELQIALDALKGFVTNKENLGGWQAGLALKLLARLQIELREFADAEKTYLALAELPLADDARWEAKVLAAERPPACGAPGQPCSGLAAGRTLEE